MPPDLLVEVAQAWLVKARGDLAIAEVAIGAAHVPGWPIGFHCQQAVEKCVKACLVLAGIKPPTSHILKDLAQLAGPGEGDFPLTADDMAALQPYAVAERYPYVAARDSTGEDVRPLLEMAQRTWAWAEGRVSAAARPR